VLVALVEADADTEAEAEAERERDAEAEAEADAVMMDAGAEALTVAFELWVDAAALFDACAVDDILAGGVCFSASRRWCDLDVESLLYPNVV
jgi:hypothetical protein